MTDGFPIRILCGDHCLSVDWDIADSGFAYPVLCADGPVFLSDSNLEKLRYALDLVEVESYLINEMIEDDEISCFEEYADEFIPEGF